MKTAFEMSKHKCMMPAVFLLAFGFFFVSGSTIYGEDTRTELAVIADPGVESAELLLFADIPVVVSAVRQAQPINQSLVPVSVVKADDIHYSGLTRVPEFLQFVPGVDYVQLDRNRYSIGVRGFHDMFANRTLVLVDGRLMDQAFFGGVEWSSATTLVEDIQRIEVVRGPGGAAWGANAYTGVVNIITKEPEDCLGWFGSSTVSHFGDSYSHIRWAEKAGAWSWRISAGYEDRRDSDDADAGNMTPMNPSVAPFMDEETWVARDHIRNWRLDSKVNYQFSKQTDLQMGLAWSRAEYGAFEYCGEYPQEEGLQHNGQLFAKLNTEGDNGDSGYLQWYGNFQDIHSPTLMDYCIADNNIDGQYNFDFAEAHKISLGGNFRWMHINTKHWAPYDMVIDSEPLDEYMAGVFVIDRWKVNDRVTLEGQFRTDWYSETQTDWASRVGAFYALDEQQNHIIRAAYAKSFRSPYTSLRELTMQRLYIPPINQYNFVVTKPAEDLKNEETWSLEAGYYGKLTKELSVRVDGYRQRLNRLISYDRGRQPGGYLFTPENIDGGWIHGIETEVALEGKPGKISAWYAYEYFKTDRHDQSTRSLQPAQNKTGVTGRLNLPWEMTFSVNYRYSTICLADAWSWEYHVSGAHRLDVTLAKRLGNWGELMVGVSDLLMNEHDPVLAFGQYSAYETPGQTVFARMQIQF